MGVVKQDHTKNTFAQKVHLVEGVGNEFFSKSLFAGIALGLPLVIVLAAGLSFNWFPVIALLTFVPVFAVFNITYANVAAPIRPQRGLAGLPLEEYITIKDSSLKSSYNGKSKIPMETFFEAYFAEKIDIKMDMLDLLEARYDWAKFVITISQAKFFLTQWIPETLWHSRKQDEDQVRDHYDRGDDFYEAFLGDTMVYTSGIVLDPKRRETLEEIQQNKLDLLTSKLLLKKGDKFLDIGCGWGALAVDAAKKGANVTGVTIARKQAKYCEDRAERNGVGKNVRILCMDYRDMPIEKFDKISCVEMSEHVGILRYQTFLRQLRELLDDDGIIFLQIAGLRRAWQYEDFVWGLFMAKYIFPGADASPPLNWVIEQFERAGFEIQSVDNIGVHYSATIYRWYTNWLKNKAVIKKKYGERWYRIWEFFLAYSTIIARQGSATCYQLIAHKNLNAVDRTRYVSRRLYA
ncbi:S-adenosyl-L-methionine-dependent methyltransferase [Cladochytrium replicatum]|nr:S-adenosyl-L-methionine-dependent methyltransferase [Cladochytrium replicatum]